MQSESQLRTEKKTFKQGISQVWVFLFEDILYVKMLDADYPLVISDSSELQFDHIGGFLGEHYVYLGEKYMWTRCLRERR